MTGSVGYRTVQLTDDLTGDTFPMGVMYPTPTPSRPQDLGPFVVDVALDAAPGDGPYPLVMLSHGRGGFGLLYRSLAHHLAANGFVVGMPDHPFVTPREEAMVGFLGGLIDRPRQLSTAIAWFGRDRVFSGVTKPGSVAVVGHSLGGYTALALAGGRPVSLPRDSPDGVAEQIPVTADPRISAVVLLATATVWFSGEKALADVTAPILLVSGELDEITPPEKMRIVLDGVPDPMRVEHRIVPGAGHYSFLSPYPEDMRKPEFAPSQDPEGFDRAAFEPELADLVLTFLREVEAGRR
jgi:predicted dienelactone hydrolase